MSTLPVLNIKQFHFKEGKGDYYANRFSTHLRTYHSSITKPHKHNFYLVVLFLQGSGVHEIDFKSYPIQPGSLFFLRPGQTHHWELSDNIDGYIFFHSQEFYDLLFPNRSVEDYPLFNEHFGRSFIQLKANDINNYFKLFRDIYNEYETSAWLSYRRFALMADLLYLDCSRLINNDNPINFNRRTKEVEWLQKLQKLIDIHYINHKKPAYYADQLNISIKHLNKMIVRSVGKSTRDLIQERVILEAKRLLTHGETSIQEIALELGFEDASYFSRLFKKKAGVSPSEFLGQYEK